jgi:GDP-L-fucose synthase|tara:strand:+ start:87 stop:1049 length:963 start_codon:yes stop_codon:yes gene_type:complete
MNKKLKVFIAGHNGMVGRSLTNYLKKKEFGKIITASRKRLNLENYDKVNRFIKQKRPDIIINCAGRVGGILANSTFPTEFLNENIDIQSNLIKSSFKNKIDHFINLGSSCIYPKNSKQPIKEKYLLSSSLEKTNEAYALAKIVGLKMCEYYNQQYKKSYFTLMPCNLYGPNDNFDLKNSHFIPALIKKIIHSKIKNKRSIEIWGTGKPKREVMHVDDLSSAIYFIIKKKLNNNKLLLNYLKKSSLINVGSRNEYTIKQYAILIAKLVENKYKLVFNKSYPDGTKRKILDNSFMKKLGWEPKISLYKGLSDTIKWYKNNYL